MLVSRHLIHITLIIARAYLRLLYPPALFWTLPPLLITTLRIREKFPIAQEDRAQLTTRARQTRLHRAKRHIHHAGDLLIGQPLHIAQDDRQPLLRAKPQQRRLNRPDHLHTKGQLLRVIGRIGQRHCQRLAACPRDVARAGDTSLWRAFEQRIERGGRMSLLSAEVVEAAVADDAQEPCAKREAMKRANRPIGRKKRALSDIGGHIGRADHPQRQRIGRRLVAFDKLIEGATVALLAARDQRLLLALRLLVAVWRA